MPLVRALLVALVVALVAMAVSGVMGSVGIAFALIFGIGSLAATWLVETRGLYMLVISLPLFYAVATAGAGFINSASSLPEGASPFSKTALLTSFFPVVQHFPVLIVTVLACALLAVIRLWGSSAQSKNRQAEAQKKRRNAAAADERNRSERLSVADLVAREGERTGRVRERDREERRREQAAQRDKYENVEFPEPREKRPPRLEENLYDED